MDRIDFHKLNHHEYAVRQGIVDLGTLARNPRTMDQVYEPENEWEWIPSLRTVGIKGAEMAVILAKIYGLNLEIDKGGKPVSAKSGRFPDFPFRPYDSRLTPREIREVCGGL